MRVFRRTQKKNDLIVSRQEGWIRLLNTLVSSTQIKPNELADAQDIQAVEDGKIQCPRDGQAYYGSSSGSRITGLFPYYKADGTNKLLRISGTNLQVYSNGNWVNVTGFTFTTGLDTNGVMAYDRLYLCNGTDPLTYFDGSVIQSFTELTPPNAPTVTRTGTAGSYTFSYKIEAVSANGQTTPSAAGSTTLNQSSLDTSNYMTVTWGAVTNAIGYNIYGRKDGQWYFIAYLEGNGSTTYVDKGAVTANEAFPPAEGNSTGGQKGKYVTLYKDSLFIAGDPNNPSRLYYSGGGDKINDFTIGGGGGFIDIAKNDGQRITGLIVFKDSLIVFKQRSIYKFNFSTSGLPQVELINPAVGCVAPRSIVAVENDVFFASDRGIFTIGNEAGFAFDVLRTNELSSKVRSIFQTIDTNYLSRISAVYATKNNANLVVFSYTPAGSTTNSQALVYDRERLGWYKWSNMQANCWTQYYDSTGKLRVLYGDDASGYTKEILTGSDDFGTAIRGYFRLKAEGFKEGERYKTLKNLHIILRKPQGTITLNIIKDGVTTAKTIPLATISPSVNFGHYLFTKFLFGDSYGSNEVSEQDNNIVRRVPNINLVGRSFMLEFDNNGSRASFTLLGVIMEAKLKSIHYYGDGEVVNS